MTVHPSSGRCSFKPPVRGAESWAEAEDEGGPPFPAKPEPARAHVTELPATLVSSRSAPWLCTQRGAAGVWDAGPALRGPPAPWGVLQVVTLKFTFR